MASRPREGGKTVVRLRNTVPGRRLRRAGDCTGRRGRDRDRRFRTAGPAAAFHARPSASVAGDRSAFCRSVRYGWAGRDRAIGDTDARRRLPFRTGRRPAAAASLAYFGPGQPVGGCPGRDSTGARILGRRLASRRPALCCTRSAAASGSGRHIPRASCHGSSSRCSPSSRRHRPCRSGGGGQRASERGATGRCPLCSRTGSARHGRGISGF